MNISGIEIGAGHPCRTVAELSNNHNGKYENAVKLLDAAKAAGADFAKIQAYFPSELVALRGDGPAPEPWGSQGWTMLALYEKAKTPSEWWPDLFDHARKIGLPLFASVFGLDSLALMEALGCPAYKIASLDLQAWDLSAVIEKTGKPTLQSAPFITMAMERIDQRAFLYCPPGYPQAHPNLRQMGEYAAFGGFSYHGTDIAAPIAAATLGAHIIEAHFQLDEEPSELEANVSLSATQFATMVREIRKVEAML